MRRIFLILALCFPALTWAATCPTNTMPSTYPGTPGSTTPANISGSACTGLNGVSTAGLQVKWVPYNSTATGCGTYAANGNTCDVMWIGPQEATTSNCFTEIYWHGGGGVSGENGESDGSDPAGTGPGPLSLAQRVQALVGKPNPIGGVYTCFLAPNYRWATNGGGAASVGLAPQNWQDAKAALWYFEDNPSIFPSSSALIGCSGDSWGGTMAFFACETPDNAYTPATGSPAVPSTEPPMRIAIGWSALLFTTPTGNSFFDNILNPTVVGGSNSGTCAAQRSVLGQLWTAANVSTYGSISNSCGVVPSSYSPSQVPSVIRATCAALGTQGQGCSPYDNIISGNTWLKNPLYTQWGSRGIYCGNSIMVPGPDCLIGGFWNGSGLVSGPATATGGVQLSTVNAFAAAGAPMPVVDEFNSFNGVFGAYCYHECWFALGLGYNDPSWILKQRFLFGANSTTGFAGIGGSVGGS